MIRIQPAYNAANVLDNLKAAELGARNLLGSGDHRDLNKYVEWAATHLRTLGPAIALDDLDALITTKLYWTFLSMLSGGGAGVMNSIPSLVALELTQRAAGLENAHDELRIEMMKSAGIDAAVLDTNVAMVMSGQLDTFDWHKALGVEDSDPVVIWIPAAVIDELDHKKRDRQNMKLNGRSVPRRSLARAALKNIDRMFPDPRNGFLVERDILGERTRQRYELRILTDEPRHIRLPSVDAEIVDQAVSLMALGGRVQVVTYDTGMRLRARSVDLAALQLPDPEDESD